MNVKKYMAIILMLLLLVPCLGACKKQPIIDTDDMVAGVQNSIEDSNDSNVEISLNTSAVKAEITTFKIAENLDSIKVLGRSTINKNGITADWSAGGIEFTVNAIGAVWISAVLDSNRAVQFKAFVNGVETGEVSFDYSNYPSKIPGTDSLNGETATIRLARIPYVKDGLITLSAIRFSGTLVENIDDKPLVEFIGDSITCGFGSVTNDDFKDGTKTFAYEAAKALGMDYSMVAISGIGVGQSTSQHGDNNIADFYKYTNYYRDSNTLYNPTKKADLVVVNLNTNDHNYGYNNSAIDNRKFEIIYKSNLRTLIADIRSIHGEKVNIVWVVGSMISSNAAVNGWLEDIFDELGGETNGLYIATVTRGNSGGAGHPHFTQHQIMARELVAFINQKDLIV